MKQKLLILSAGLMLLTACHASNPLMKANKNNLAKLLMNAEIYAQQKTHLYDSSSSVYLTCVKNPKHFDNPFKQSNNPCHHYLETMLKYIHKHSQFKNLDLQQLQSPSLLKKITKTLSNDEVR